MFVVTLPPSAQEHPRAFAERALHAGADILEIRGDLTPDVSLFESPLPLLVSPRGSGDTLVQSLQPAYVDLEGKEEMQLPHGSQLIRSFHDYKGTPSARELKTVIEEMLFTDPDVIKIATTVTSYEDVETLRQVHSYIPHTKQSVIVGMGTRAHMQRLQSPLHNALTYTYLDGEEAAAPGQIPLSLYKTTAHVATRWHASRKRAHDAPQLFGILGSLDVRSASPLIHNTLFQRHDLHALYSLCLTDDLSHAWQHLTAAGVRGFSVTSPWKQDIIPFLDELHADAEVLQSVNTAVYEDGSWIGYTRDTTGLLKGYPFLEKAPSIALVGSGGVMPAVIHACKIAGIQDIRLYARNQQTREDVATRFGIRSAALEELPKNLASIVLCGVSNDVRIDLPQPEGTAYAIDIRYGKKTLFMEHAEQLGYSVHDGIPMLLFQALAQFQLFTGIKATEEDRQATINLLTVSN